MKGYFTIAVLALTCRSPGPQSAKARAAVADSVWKARVISSVCRSPAYVTSNWPSFLTANGTATIRIPAFLRQDQFQPAAEPGKANGRRKLPPYASEWQNIDSGGDLAQLSLGVRDSVRLAYPGVPEPEESICLEKIDGAQATLLAYNHGAARSNGAAVGQRARAAGDSAASLGSYWVDATMRFPDGIGLSIVGAANTVEQQNQMLAAIRTIRRVNNPPVSSFQAK
jgi:hypothetical protein